MKVFPVGKTLGVTHFLETGGLNPLLTQQQIDSTVNCVTPKLYRIAILAEKNFQI
jgi:hypothetical protein